MQLSESQISAIRSSWSRDTCYPKNVENWSTDNPAVGQCAVTALLVQNLLGGDIIFSEKNNHYWNRVLGEEIDLTREQFGRTINTTDAVIVDRDSLFQSETSKTLERYLLLKSSFESICNQ